MLLSPSEKIDTLTGLFNINLHYTNICNDDEREELRRVRGIILKSTFSNDVLYSQEMIT